MSMGERLAQAREQADLTQEALGAAVGVTRQAISMIEGGVTKDVSVGRVADLARVLKVNPCWLAFGSAEGPGVDAQVLQDVISAVVTVANQRGVSLSHPKLALLISALYESEVAAAGTLPGQIKRLFNLIL